MNVTDDAENGRNEAEDDAMEFRSGIGSGIDIPSRLFCYRVDRSRVLLGGALTDGGSVVEWARSFLNLRSDDDFDACMAEVSRLYEDEGKAAKAAVATPPPSSSLTVIPFLSGERSTGFRNGAKGCISGVTRETTATHFMFSCLEAVILRIGAVLTLIRETTERTKIKGSCIDGAEHDGGCIVASGNALERNALWRQMLADCSGREVLVDADAVEGTSRGVALLVSRSLVVERKLRRRRVDDDETNGPVT